MTITLDANPSDAPCCIKIIAADGRDLLIQTDWDWPGIATTFGWDIKSVQNVPACYADWQEVRRASNMPPMNGVIVATFQNGKHVPEIVKHAI